MDTPGWALTIAYWMHMLATVVWIGSLTALALFVLPAARRSLDALEFNSLLNEIRRRLDPWSWFSLAVLLATGMLQMSSNPNYGGFLAIDNRWAIAILIKHVLFLGMAGLSAYITWGLLPRLQRLALRQAYTNAEASAQEMQGLQRQEARLVNINLVLGVLILALTAVARSV